MNIEIGKSFETKTGSFVVTEYLDSRNVKIRFENSYETICRASQVLEGNVRNPYFPSVCGIGFLGKGLYSRKTHTTINLIWNNMLKRCYNKDMVVKKPSYSDCIVDVEWHNFQNFAYDYEQMAGSDKGWQLDKDILVKGNKLYSKETCCLVPQHINNLFTKNTSKRGDLPIGVNLSGNESNPYQAACSVDNHLVYLGVFSTAEEAFQAYKQAKESEIKRVAKLYRFQLDPKVFKALIEYEVSIND